MTSETEVRTTEPPWRRLTERWTLKNWFLLAALVASLLLLSWLLLSFGSIITDRIRVPDYYLFRRFGREILAGQGAYESGRLYYPLPTAIFVFVPLALLPEQVRWLWVAAPVLLLFLILGRDAVWALPFLPLLVHTKWGQLSGVLAIFYVWLNSENKRLSGVGAGLFCLKPQVAAIPVLWSLWRWCRDRDKERLLAFCGTLAFLCLPAFLLEPDWPIQWLRNARPFQPFVSPSVWGFFWGLRCLPRWFWLWVTLSVLAIAISAGLVMWRHRRELDLDKISTWGFLVNPFIFVYDQVLLLPTLKGKRNAIIMVTGLSYACMLVEGLVLGDGAGSFVLVPLTLLATWRWHTRPRTSSPTLDDSSARQVEAPPAPH